VHSSPDCVDLGPGFWRNKGARQQFFQSASEAHRAQRSSGAFVLSKSLKLRFTGLTSDMRFPVGNQGEQRRGVVAKPASLPAGHAANTTRLSGRMLATESVGWPRRRKASGCRRHKRAESCAYACRTACPANRKTRQAQRTRTALATNIPANRAQR
jgi:hypothetical protein